MVVKAALYWVCLWAKYSEDTIILLCDTGLITPIVMIKTMRLGNNVIDGRGPRSPVSSRIGSTTLFSVAPTFALLHMLLGSLCPVCAYDCAGTTVWKPALLLLGKDKRVSNELLNFGEQGFSFFLLLLYNKMHVLPLPIIVYSPLTHWWIFNPDRTTLISQLQLQFFSSRCYQSFKRVFNAPRAIISLLELLMDLDIF